MVNKVIVIGNLGRDPETRSTGGGQDVCNFSVACSEKFKDRDGNPQERTEWVRVVAWGKLAGLCQQYLAKGRQVYVEGKLQTRKWQDKDGKDQYATEVVAAEVRFLGNREGGRDDSRGTSHGSAPSTRRDDRDEDIPFVRAAAPWGV